MNFVFAEGKNSDIVCTWLPWCDKGGGALSGISFLTKVISEGIKYVAVVAVISVMLSWIMYILANGKDENETKARKWIIWSLVAVFLSISAWALINLLNGFKI